MDTEFTVFYGDFGWRVESEGEVIAQYDEHSSASGAYAVNDLIKFLGASSTVVAV